MNVLNGIFGSPLQIAVATRNEEIVRLLFSSGANIVRSLYPQLENEISEAQIPACAKALTNGLFETMSQDNQPTPFSYYREGTVF